jgi:hypothetical protein
MPGDLDVAQAVQLCHQESAAGLGVEAVEQVVNRTCREAVEAMIVTIRKKSPFFAGSNDIASESAKKTAEEDSSRPSCAGAGIAGRVMSACIQAGGPRHCSPFLFKTGAVPVHSIFFYLSDAQRNFLPL